MGFSTDTTTIRLATEADAAAVAAIYGPYCEHSIVSFETSAPTPAEMAARIAKVLAEWPWLVLEWDGGVAGYAYASRHRDRAAYMWAVDTAVYVATPFHRRGVGRALYTTLFALLGAQGYRRACAGVALPNDASVHLHQAVGFTPIGVYRRIGFKHGAWRDVAWFQADIGSETREPVAPVPWAQVAAQPVIPGWDAAVAAGLATLRRS